MWSDVRRAIWLSIVYGTLFLGPGLHSAEAHAELLSAYPAPGASLATTPPEIRLTFSERIGPGSSIQLYGPQFRAVSGVRSGLDPAAPQQLRAFTPELAADTYTVEWRAISADGHEVTGSYAFAIMAPATPRPPASGLFVVALLILLVVSGVAWQMARQTVTHRPAPPEQPEEP